MLSSSLPKISQSPTKSTTLHKKSSWCRIRKHHRSRMGRTILCIWRWKPRSSITWMWRIMMKRISSWGRNYKTSQFPIRSWSTPNSCSSTKTLLVWYVRARISKGIRTITWIWQAAIRRWASKSLGIKHPKILMYLQLDYQAALNLNLTNKPISTLTKCHSSTFPKR